jgi:hypothetical protein
MGGGESKTKQTMEVIQESITHVVQKNIMEKTVSVSNSQNIHQIIENINFILPPLGYCPPGQMPNSVVIRQATAGEQQVALTMDMLNASELANLAKTDLEGILSNEVKKEKKGFTSSDSTSVDQDIKISDHSYTSIYNEIRNTLNTYINQQQKMGQTIKYISLAMPCGNVEITQDSQAKQIASDIGKAVAGVAVKLEEFKSITLGATAVDKQKSSDLITSVADSFSDMVQGVAGSFSMAVMMPFVAIVVLVFVATKLGGGSDSNNGDE